MDKANSETQSLTIHNASLSPSEWFETLNSAQKQYAVSIILEGDKLFPDNLSSARTYCLNKSFLTSVQYDWLYDLRSSLLPSQPVLSEAAFPLVVDVSFSAEVGESLVPNEPVMTPSSPHFTPVPALVSTPFTNMYLPTWPPSHQPTPANCPSISGNLSSDPACSHDSKSESNLSLNCSHARSNVKCHEPNTVPSLVNSSAMSSPEEISTDMSSVGGASLTTSRPFALSTTSSLGVSLSLRSLRSGSNPLYAASSSLTFCFSDSFTSRVCETGEEKKHDVDDDRKRYEEFDYKSDFRELLHVALPSESDSFLCLCASVKTKLQKTTDDPEVLSNWVVAQADILDKTITNELGAWFEKQNWERGQQEVKGMWIDQNLLEMFQFRLDAFCRADMRPGTNLMDSYEAARLISHATEPHAIPFFELIRKISRSHYFFEARKKSDIERIATKIEEHVDARAYQAYAFVKDMIGVRLYFRSAEEAVREFRKFYKEQDKHCIEYLNGPPLKTKNFRHQHKFAILQVKPKLTSTLRNIHVVLGTFDSEGVPIIGEVQFSVSPTQENAFAFAKLHTLYEIRRECENKQKMSAKVTRELCNCINKLYPWGISKDQRIESTRLFSLVVQQLKLCDQLRKKIAKVGIARALFAELDVCLEDFEIVLREFRNKKDENGLCEVLVKLRGMLLDTQEFVVKCSGKNSESLLRTLYNEAFQFEDWWSFRTNIDSNNSSSEVSKPGKSFFSVIWKKNDTQKNKNNNDNNDNRQYEDKFNDSKGNSVCKETEVATFLQTIADKTVTLDSIRNELPLQAPKERKLPDGAADIQEINRLLSFLALLKARGPAISSQDLGTWLDWAEIADNLDLLQSIWAEEFRVSWEQEYKQCGADYDGKVQILQNKLQNVIANVQTLVPKLKAADVLVVDAQAVLAEEERRVSELSFQLAVVGPMKSGKSTIINALIGLRLLPERTFPMTMFCTIVRHKPGQKEPILLLKKETLAPFLRAVSQIRTTAAAMGLGLPLALGKFTLDYEPNSTDPFHFLSRLSQYFQADIVEYFSKEHRLSYKSIDFETLIKQSQDMDVNEDDDAANQVDRPLTEGAHLASFLFERASARYETLKASVRDQIMQKELFIFLGHKEKEDELLRKLDRRRVLRKMTSIWRTRVGSAIGKVLSLQSMEKQVFQSILAGTINLKSLTETTHGTEPCCQVLQLLTMISRVAVAFGLQNPACLIEEHWPKIKVHFRTIDHERRLLGKFSLIDTPGPDEATEADLSQVVNKVLKDSNAVLCVLNSTTFRSKAEEEIKRGVTSMRQLRNHQVQNLTIVCNKYDIANISMEDATQHVVHQFGVPSAEVYFASGKLACLANDIDAYFEANDTKPLIDFTEESLFQQWASVCFGNRPAAVYNLLSVQDLKNRNIDVKKDSRIEFLMDRILNNMVCRAGCLVMEHSIRRIELTFETACNNIDSRYTMTSCGVNEARKELERLKRAKWNAEQALIHWNLTSNGVKTERGEDGNRILKVVEPRGVKLMEEYIAQKTSDWLIGLKDEIRSFIIDEFKATPERYIRVTSDNISEFREEDLYDHVLRFKSRRSLCRRLRQISIQVFQFVQARFNGFVSLLRLDLKDRLSNLNRILNSDLLEVDPALARLSLHNDSISNTVPNANPLCAPKTLVEESRLQATTQRLWYTLFLTEGEVKGKSIAQAFLKKVNKKWSVAIDDLTDCFSQQILADFRRTIERQRLAFFKACGQQFDIRDRSIAECQNRLSAPQSSGSFKARTRAVAEVKLSLFSRLLKPVEEVRFWTERFD